MTTSKTHLEFHPIAAEAGAQAERFEQLFHATRGDVLAYLTRRAETAEAADLLAEVYLVAWRRRADLPAGRERLWLFGAARRLLAQHHREQAVHQHRSLHEELAQQRPLLADDQIENEMEGSDGPSRTAAVVRDALAGLVELDRELITLTAWEQLSTADAARVVGISATGARVRLHRARRRLAAHPQLRRLLGEEVATAADSWWPRPATDQG
ncbi:RNA polymerase sigma factor [Kineococcus arenarius]|uniref:RNA polymerase sigma factor n=1 Tax=unclassified Kineococcus TaxID=2621656 RepID=UPI003D7E2C46